MRTTRCSAESDLSVYHPRASEFYSRSTFGKQRVRIRSESFHVLDQKNYHLHPILFIHRRAHCLATWRPSVPSIYLATSPWCARNYQKQVRSGVKFIPTSGSPSRAERLDMIRCIMSLDCRIIQIFLPSCEVKKCTDPIAHMCRLRDQSKDIRFDRIILSKNCIMFYYM